jgi:hypothetical protein
VSVIKGYRLVCEVCGNKSNYVLEENADPETQSFIITTVIRGTLIIQCVKLILIILIPLAGRKYV